MKLITADKGKFSFQIERREKEALFEVIKLYPLIPVTHQRLTQSEERPEDQQLLEEALAAQRAINQRQVTAMLNAKSRFRENQSGYRFSLSAEQMEWLLQVLNDVRVGSWLVLGSPDGSEKSVAALNEQTAPYFWILEVAGHFQMALVRAMSGDATESGGE